MYLPDNLLLCASFILRMLETGLLHDVWELSLSPLHVVAYHDNEIHSIKYKVAVTDPAVHRVTNRATRSHRLV